ncbi:MAG: alpha/beta fold hydrolase [Burkholderiaceae bacterium]|nr:alpha/beta fold hydrolase [Sulfuritalea sp.]MCF8175788.1 alpha/beta fold hydrolase [Burkholderiaceae bacterium]MCF8183635.1 alpha/beta fold hydrolase [Polynucleobacter sp.]
MAARQFRWLLFGELLFYVMLGYWLVSGAGWTPLQAAGLALVYFFGMRLGFVGLSFLLMLNDRDTVPPELRVGPLGVLRMVLKEYVALILLFVALIPFHAFWLGPDRLGKPTPGRLPLLLIHGYQCNRGFWFWLRPRLEAAGWVVATHNLEPVYSDIDVYAQGIAQRIDQVLAATGASQVILIGHSMGGLASRAYLRRHGNEKVARLITLGSPHQGTKFAQKGLGPNAKQMRIGSTWLNGLGAPGAAPLPPGSVSIYSCHDNYAYPQQASSTLEGATHVAIGGVSHIGMAISPRVLSTLLKTLDTSTS